MILTVGMKYIVEIRDEDYLVIKKELSEDSQRMLGDWEITDSLENLRKQGIITRLYESKITWSEVKF